MFVRPTMFNGAKSTIVIAASVNDFNLFTFVGSPVNPVNLRVIIEAGVILGSTDRVTPAFNAVGFAAGSQAVLIIKGTLRGKGGAGGKGGDITSTTDCFLGSVGEAGGIAINSGLRLYIDNTAGNIFGGGGGGGGAVGQEAFGTGYGGGGGGGGQSHGSSIGGAGGQILNGSVSQPGTAGTNGTDSGPGTGGVGGTGSSAYGGNGGGWGENGSQGGTTPVCGDSGVNGAVGGVAGKAIELNGHPITWLGGNNPTQVKGLVS